MARPLLPDSLWGRVEPLLPPPKPRRSRHPGRKPLGDREALTGILFILRSGLPWEMLPCEMGCGSGMSCWRRLRDWRAEGVWGRLVAFLRDRHPDAGHFEWGRAVVGRRPGRTRRKNSRRG